MYQWATTDHDLVWPCPGPSWRSPKSALRHSELYFTSWSYDRSWLCPIWMRFVYSCLTTGQNGLNMLSVRKTWSAARLPSRIKNKKWRYMRQWATMDNIRAWPCPGQLIKYWDLTMEMSDKVKIGLKRSYWMRWKFYLMCIKVLLEVMTVPNVNGIGSFMSENGLRSVSHNFMLSIWKM